MAVAFCRSQTLTRLYTNPAKTFHSDFSKDRHVYSRLLTLRSQSSQPNNNDSSLITVEPDVEALAVQRIEDAIHGIIVKRSAPDWLLFRPGSSYWVPPRRQSYGIAELVRSLANNLTEDEILSLTTARGWPSSTFFTTDYTSDTVEEDTTSTNVSKLEHEE